MLMQSSLSDNDCIDDRDLRILDKKIDIARNDIIEALLRLGKFLSVDIHNFDIKQLALKNHFQNKEFIKHK